MGRLEKLRSRFFSRKYSPTTKLPTDLTIASTSINATSMDGSHGCTVQRIGGHLCWSEARRTYSDPTTTRTSADVAENRKPSANARRSKEESETEDWLSTDHDVTDDDVFLDLEETEDDVTVSTLESYGEFAALQRSSGWKWPAAITLPEEVLTAWEDWRVPPHKLDVDTVVSCTNRETIYSGYWHGKVCVHSREARAVQDVVCFLNEVQTLSCIRHQNIQLFMGASVSTNTREPLLLIMSELKGLSLHTRLHSYSHSFTNHSKLIILHQIAEGMAYLHAKNIPHGLLTTTHISLHTCRICISLPPQKSDSQTFYPPELTYLPPEYIRTLHLNSSTPSRAVSTSVQVQRSWRADRRLSVCGGMTRRRLRSVTLGCTRASVPGMCAADVFAFGTIAYELATLKHPFTHVPLECLILCVGRGECQSVGLITNRLLRTVVRDCWSSHPHTRPTFRELVKSLEQNMKVTPPTQRIKRSASLPTLHSDTCSSQQL